MFAPLTDGGLHPHAWTCAIRVCSAYEARQHGQAWGTTHLLSIRQPAIKLRTMQGIPEDRHLALLFDDVEDEDEGRAPTPEHVAAVCAWTDGLPADARLLIHCMQGVHRSAAIGLGLLARYLTPERAGAVLHGLRPVAEPNKLMVSQWDAALGHDGALNRIARRFPCRTWKGKGG